MATASLAAFGAHAANPVTWETIAALPKPPFDERIAYGGDSLQFGELRMPKGKGPFPVAIVIHGGCWRAEYDLEHITPLAAALTARGVATWTIEYRRIGNAGGGWPGTFEDVARAAEYVRSLAMQYPIDFSRVVVVGHSAGGHLGLWLAARGHLPAGSELGSPHPLPLRGVIGLAAISDLASYAGGPSYCMKSAALLMGGAPDSLAGLYAQADPMRLLPLGVPVRLVHGTADKIVPIEQSRAFEKKARAQHDAVKLEPIEGAAHFDMVLPEGKAFEVIAKDVKELLAPRGRAAR